MIRATPGITVVPGDARRSGLRVRLSQGDQGTLETLWAMRALVEQGAAQDVTKKLARGLIDSGGLMATLRKVHAWLAKRVAFRDDSLTALPYDGASPETLRPVAAMLADVARKGIVHGDCDELATLAAAILYALGQDVVLVVVGRDAASDYEHVFAGVRYKHRLLCFDTQEGIPIDGDNRAFARRLIFPLRTPRDRMPPHLITAPTRAA